MDAVRRLSAAAVPLRAVARGRPGGAGRGLGPGDRPHGEERPDPDGDRGGRGRLQRGLDAAAGEGRARDAAGGWPSGGAPWPGTWCSCSCAASRRGTPRAWPPKARSSWTSSTRRARRAASAFRSPSWSRRGRAPARPCASWACASRRRWRARRREGGAAPAPAGSTAPLRLDGAWTGAEMDAEGRKLVTVRFSGTSGSLSYQRALSVSVPLTGVEQPRKGQVALLVEDGRGHPLLRRPLGRGEDHGHDLLRRGHHLPHRQLRASLRAVAAGPTAARRPSGPRPARSPRPPGPGWRRAGRRSWPAPRRPRAGPGSARSGRSRRRRRRTTGGGR